MPENIAEGLITTVEDRGNGTVSWSVKEKWMEDGKYVYLIESTFHLYVKEDFFFVCSGVVGDPENAARSTSQIKGVDNRGAPWKSKTEFIQEYVEAKGRWEELCVEFFGSPPVFCEVPGCAYRTQGKLCEKHVESEAAQEQMFNE